MFDVDGIKTLLHSRLSKKRYNHSLNVAAEARKLAFRYGVDPDRAYAAGLLIYARKKITASLKGLCSIAVISQMRSLLQSLSGMLRQALFIYRRVWASRTEI